MAIIDLERIKKLITLFFAVALLIQVGFIFYVSQGTAPATDIAMQLVDVKRASLVTVLSISLNLIVILVAVYGINVSMITCHRRN